MKRLIIHTVALLMMFSCSTYEDENTVHSGDSVANDDSSNDSGNSDYSLLFIGNSLTYTNGLPALVKDAASTQGITITTKMIAYSNYGLEDHWNDGVIQDLINTEKYDYVIIQQGPSSQAAGRASLIEYGGRIADLCQMNNTQLAFFMVWPSMTYYHTFPGVITNYTDAASLSGAILCPAGKVWKDYFDQTNDFSYYGPDNFHPSLSGSEVAAAVILESLDL